MILDVIFQEEQTEVPVDFAGTIYLKGDKGEKGDKGDKGDKGESAYESAQDGGYTGTEEEFESDLANFKTLAETAAGAAEDAEAWAVGKRDGVDVGSGDETYHNNSKYYAWQAASSASSAADSETAAETAQEKAEAAQTAAEAATVHQPVVGSNGNWYIWSQQSGGYVDSGISAHGLPGKDTPYCVDVDENGHLLLYYTGDEVPDFSINDNGHLIYTVNAENSESVDIGNVVGPAGQDGQDGAPGRDGQDGQDGADGQDGQDGKSAYESAQDGGYTGTESQFNSDLAGIGFKYSKPASGIPASDLTEAVRTSLGKADTALQAVPNTYRTAAEQDVIDAGKAPKVSIAPVESGTTASTAYGVGKWFYLGDKLCKAKVKIFAGDTFVRNTNYIEITVAAEVKEEIEDIPIPRDAADVGAMPDTADLDDIPDGTTYKRATAAQLAQIATNTSAIAGKLSTSLKGAASGLAELDENGKVPSSQLPSYVDDVLEYASTSAFPATGEAGKIYVATNTNLTYRWSGSAYVEISPSLALGETSSTAYRGDRGKTAYDHSQLASGNPHNVSKSDVGLGNVDNTSDATKKTNFTGAIADGNTGFVTGDDAYDALAAKYEKPSGGIPASDLASAVQTSLGKADTALQSAPVTSVNSKTGAVVLSAADVGAASSDLGISGATVGQYVKIKTVDGNGKPTEFEPGTPSGGGGGGEALWNHVAFSVTDESERTTRFIVNNSSQLSEILACGTVVFDSYDGFIVKFSNSNEPPISNSLNVSATNKYVALRLWRAGDDYWHGVGTANQWGVLSSWSVLISPRKRNRGNSNIQITSMWANKTFLEGTSIDVYWR